MSVPADPSARWKHDGVRVAPGDRPRRRAQAVGRHGAHPRRTETLECVLCRSDGQAVAVSLDIEPAEPPEDVPWIDPTHPA